MDTNTIALPALPPGFIPEAAPVGVPPTMGKTMPALPPGFIPENSPIPLSNETISARTPGMLEKVGGFIDRHTNLGQLEPTLEKLAQPPSMVGKMPDSAGKALLEQVTLPNIGLLATGGPVISALSKTTLGKAVLAGILAKFGVEGAKEAGTEFGTAAGDNVKMPKPGVGGTFVGAMNEQDLTPEQEEHQYHVTRGLIAALSALPAAGAGKFGESLSRIPALPSGFQPEMSGVDLSKVGKNLQDVSLQKAVSTAKEGDAQRPESLMERGADTPLPPTGVKTDKSEGLTSQQLMSGIPLPKEWLEKVRPVFIGKQDDFSGKTEGFNMYNLKGPILDDSGKVLHSEGSTVSEGTLKKYGVAVPGQEGQSQGEGKMNAGPDVDWKKLKEKVGLGEEDWTHQGVKIAMTDSGFKRTDTEVDAGQLKNRIINKLNPDSSEAKMWKGLGIDEKFKQGEKTSPEKMAEWMTENGPRVEVRKFGVASQDTQTKRLAEITHLVDTKYKDYAIHGANGSINHYGIGDNITHFEAEAIPDPELRKLMVEYKDLQSKRDLSTSNSSHWQSIAPKSEQDMPGYVEIAVVKPTKQKVTKTDELAIEHGTMFGQNPNRLASDIMNNRGIQFSSSHSFPPNTIGFVRGYMENVEGKKVFHVIEVQSDWAQRERETKARDTASPVENDLIKKERDKTTEPLLPHYERLALKAAIDHARKEGADEIAISDAETAMMTEGHDRQIPEGYILENPTKGQMEPSQAPGMRLHYDRTLPKIAEELTGEKGRRVEFGEHKMALDNPNYALRENADVRKDLVFRNPDSTPKTSVSARSFPISKPSTRLATAEPFTQMGKLYSGVELPEAVQDAIKRALFISRSSYNAPEVVKDAKGTLVESLEKASTSPFESKPTSKFDPESPTKGLQAFQHSVNKVLNAAAVGDKLVMPTDAVGDILDGTGGKYNGWWMTNVKKAIDTDFNNEYNLQNTLTEPLRKVVKDNKLSEDSAHRIGVYANLQQEGGKERLLAMGATPEQLERIKLTPAEMEYYQTARAVMDSIYPEVARVMRAVGLKPAKMVENYWPMPRDYSAVPVKPQSLIQGTFDEHGTYKMMGEDLGIIRGEKIEPGFTKERKKFAKAPIQVNAFQLLQTHLEEASHVIAMGQRLYELGKVVRSDLFREKFGDLGQSYTADFLNTLAYRGRTGRTVKILDTIKNKIAKGTIGWRLASQFVHSSSVALAMDRTNGPLPWMRGLDEAVTQKGSQFLKDHFGETFERAGGELTLAESSKGGRSKVFIIERLIDQYNAQATALGVYMNELEAKGFDPRGYAELPIDQAAVAKARVLARRAVASPLYKDLPLAISRGGTYAKALFQYETTMMNIWSNIRHDFAGAGLGMEGKPWNPAYAARAGVALAGLLLLASGMKFGAKYYTGRLVGAPKQSDDEFKHGYWDEVSKEATRFVPMAPQLLSLSEYGDSGVPIVDTVENLGHGIYKVITGKDRPFSKTDKDAELEKSRAEKQRLQGLGNIAQSGGQLLGIAGTTQLADLVKQYEKHSPITGKGYGGKKKQQKVEQ